MIFILLLGFYSYLTLRFLFFTFVKKGAEVSGGYRILERIAFVVFMVSVSSYFLTNQDIFTSFIIPKLLFYISLTLNLLFLGIGIGFDLLFQLPEIKGTIHNSLVRYITKFSLELSSAFFLFLITILETSKTNMYQETSIRKIILTFGSIVVGLIISYRLSQEDRVVKILYNTIFSVLGLSLLILILEANTGLVFATMYLFFCASFIASNIAWLGIKYRHIFKKRELVLPVEELNVVPVTTENIEEEKLPEGFTRIEQTIITQEEKLTKSGVEFLSNDDVKEDKPEKESKKTLLASEDSASNISLAELKS